MLYIRDCELVAGSEFFTTVDKNGDFGLTITWSYKIKKYNEPGKLKIKIFNPSPDVIKNLHQFDIIKFGFGYDKRIVNFFNGILDTFKVNVKGVDTVLELDCIEQDKLIFQNLSVSYERGTLASYVISDIISRSGLVLNQIDLVRDKKFSSGYCVYGKPVNELRELVQDCESKMKIEGKVVYIYNEEINTKEIVLLDYESGLLAEPQKFIESAFKEKKEETLYTHVIRSLAIPDIRKNSLVKIIGDYEELTGQVIEMEINDNYETTYKIKKVGN